MIRSKPTPRARHPHTLHTTDLRGVSGGSLLDGVLNLINGNKAKPSNACTDACVNDQNGKQ